jgi:hypothetical protein
MNFSTGLTAWRDARSIGDAVKHHDRAQLAVAVSLVISFGATLLKGKYAQYATFLDPDTVTAVGVLIAGAAAGFGHWATGGALAGVAVVASNGAPGGPSPGVQGSLDQQHGGQTADAGAPVQVRRGSDDPAQSNPLAGGP